MTDTVILSVSLTGFPPLPNATRREHWAKRGDEAAQWRNDARLVALQALRENANPSDFPLTRAVVEIVVLWPDNTGPDPDGAVSAAKPILDGMTDAGVWRNDSFRVIGRLSVRRETGPKGLRVDVVAGSVA